MVVPIHYRKSTEGNLVNYSWTDFAEGTGIVKLYCGHSIASGATATTYRLDRNAFLTPGEKYAGDTGTAVTANFVKTIDIDFDLSSFNSPRTLKGTMISNFNTQFVGTGYSYFIVRVRKVRGVTETEIASSATITGAPGSALVGIQNLITTIPLTNFKKDDKLRITIEGYGKADSGTVYPIVIFDPQDGAFSETIGGGAVTANAGETVMQHFVPFRIDL